MVYSIYTTASKLRYKSNSKTHLATSSQHQECVRKTNINKHDSILWQDKVSICHAIYTISAISHNIIHMASVKSCRFYAPPTPIVCTGGKPTNFPTIEKIWQLGLPAYQVVNQKTFKIPQNLWILKIDKQQEIQLHFHYTSAHHYMKIKFILINPSDVLLR